MQNSQQHLLIIGYVWPEPTATAAGSRMMQLIHLFLKTGYEVTFASPAAEGEHPANLVGLGVNATIIELNSESFDTFVKELQPTVVMFDRFMMEEQFGWRVTAQCPSALQLLDMEDLHCLRKVRHGAFKAGQTFRSEDLLNSDLAKREIASIYRCDLSLVISKVELKLLQDLFKIGERQLHYLPFMVPNVLEEDMQQWPTFEERAHFVTIGNFLHAPNVDSVKYLKKDVWPLIRKQLPNAELHIYGAYVTQAVQQLHNPKQGFLVKGWTEDVSIVMKQARVCLAPLRFGAGLKGKLLSAMQAGTPNVTTSIGAEGMHDNLPWGGFVSDDPNEIADQAIRLYREKSDWSLAQTNGVTIVKQLFDESYHKAELMRKITETFEQFQTHRELNFTGAMLRHHTLQSTKYMAKWIEAKNRLK